MTNPETFTDDIERENAEWDQIHTDLQEMGASVLPGFSAKIDVLRMELEALANRFKTRDPYAKDLIFRDTSLAIQALREAAGWTRDAASRIPPPVDPDKLIATPMPSGRPSQSRPRPIRHLDFVQVPPPTPPDAPE